MSEQAAKVCSMCGQDVSGKPRSKDAEGRYVCAECLKGKAPAGAAAKPTAKQAAKVSGEENAFLLDLGGKPLAVSLCSNCQQPMRAGAKLCTFCGFNQEEGKALRTVVTKEKAAKERGPKVKKPMGPFPKYFLMALGPVAIPAGIFLGTGEPMAILAAGALLGIVSLVVGIWAIIACFKEGLLHGLLSIFFWPWALYVVFIRQESQELKGAYAGVYAALVVYFVAFFVGAANAPQSEQSPTGAPATQPAPTAQPSNGPTT